MLREAFEILALSEKDLDPRALEAVLTARLETAEFHDIPRLLEAYRTVNSLLETQLWYWNPETTSIHQQDGSTIELRGANAGGGVMTAPPPPNAPPNPARKSSDTGEVELITDTASRVPTAPVSRAVMADDDPMIVDDEAETRQSTTSLQNTLAPGTFEESAHLRPSTARPDEVAPPRAAASRASEAPRPPQDQPGPSLPKSESVITGNAPARMPEALSAAQPGGSHIAPAPDADDDLEPARTTMVFVPKRRAVTAPWMVAVAAFGLAAGLWVLQSQTGRTAQRNAAVPTTTAQPREVTSAPTPTRPSSISPKPVQKPATTRPSASSPTPRPPVGVTPKPTAATVTPSRPSGSVRDDGKAPARPPKPSAQPPVKPAKPPLAVRSAQSSTPPPAPARPVAAKPQQTPSFATARPVSPAPRPVRATAPVRKPVPISRPRPQVRPAVKPPAPAAKPAVRPAPKPVAKPVVTPAPSIPTRPATATTINPRPNPVSVPAPVAVIEAPRNTGLPDNLTREEYGRRYFNQKIFEVWQRSGAQLRYASWEAIPLEIQTLNSGRFRSAVYIAPPPEPEEPPR